MYRMAFAITIIEDLIVFIPQRKKIRIINIILIGFLLFIAFHVRKSPDINNYIARFNYDYAGHDYGFIFLAHLFRDHGATFYEFQNWYFFASISMIAYGLIRLTANRTLIYILYFFFPFLLNLVQIRNFMVLAFLILAIGMCYGNDNKKVKRIWWCVLCGLAATQHIVAIAYIPFVFVWDNKKVLKYIIIGSSIVTALLFVFPGRMVALISEIVNLVADETRSDMYGVRTTQLGIIVMVLESVAMMLIARFSAVFVSEYNKNIPPINESKLIESSHFDFVVNLLYYSSVFWPFYFLNGNYTRLMQNEFLIVYMAIATMIRYAFSINRGVARNVKMSNTLIGAMAIFVPLYISGLSTLWGGLYDNVVVPILMELF